jgi:lysophospholipase L1-like esterase
MSALDAVARGLASQAMGRGRTGIRLAALGDSIVEHGRYPATGQIDTTKLRTDAWGFTTWAAILSGRRFAFDWSANFGLAGDTLVAGGPNPGMASRVPAILATRPHAVILMAGTNDDTALTGAAQSYGVLKAICRTLTAAGIKVVLMTTLPRASFAALTTPQILYARQQAAQRRHLCFALAKSLDNVFVFDAAALFQSPTAAGLADAGLFFDGVHPNNKGAFVLGRALATYLGQIFPGTAYAADLGYDPVGDAYDASANPSGNLLANPTLQGAVALSGTYWSGVAPTGWTGSNSNGGPAGVVTRGAGAQLAARPDGLPGTQWQMTLGNASAAAANGGYGQALSLSQTLTTGIVPGAAMQARMAVDVAGSPVSLWGVRLQIRFRDAGGASIYTVADGEPQTAGGGLPDGVAWSGVLETPACIVPATAASAIVSIDAYLDQTNASAAAVIQPKYAHFGRIVSA